MAALNHPTPWRSGWAQGTDGTQQPAILDATGTVVMVLDTLRGKAVADRITASVNAGDPLLSRADVAGRRWVIRQQVRTARKSWMVDLGECHSERVARDDYERLVREHPESYFELVEVVHVETCLAFTPFKGSRC